MKTSLGVKRKKTARDRCLAATVLAGVEAGAGWRRMSGVQELPALETKVIPPDLGSGDAREGI